ncbi:MAG: hypothetical protein EBZ78_13765 [Verrucomicrobia bacterium]|nr:hypothetical protein [Verrucomicrobiota bacterium]
MRKPSKSGAGVAVRVGAISSIVLRLEKTLEQKGLTVAQLLLAMFLFSDSDSRVIDPLRGDFDF